MNILIVFPFLLHSNIKHGCGKQTLRLIKGLHHLGHRIYLVCLSETDYEPYREQIDELSRYCVELKIFSRPKLNLFIKIINFLRPSLPPHARNCLSSDAQRYIQNLANTGCIDVANIVFACMGEYAKKIDNKKCTIIIDTLEIETRKYLIQLKSKTSLAIKLHSLITYLRTMPYEKKLIQNVSGVIAISEEEKSFLNKKYNYDNVLIIPSLIEKDDFPLECNESKENLILFFGSFNHTPNVDAMRWFCKFIFPIIVKEIPDVALNIVGENAIQKLHWLKKKEKIHIKGTVKDMKPWILEATVVVSPIITGAGARIKNIEALSMGKPLVTTSLGAEGLSSGDKPGCYIEDEPKNFAKRVIELLKSHELREMIGETGKRNVKENHDNLLNAGRFINYCKSIKRY